MKSLAGSLGASDCGQQNTLADFDREIVLVAFEAERTRHAAAARIEHFIIESNFLENGFLGFQAQPSCQKQFFLKAQALANF